MRLHPRVILELKGCERWWGAGLIERGGAPEARRCRRRGRKRKRSNGLSHLPGSLARHPPTTSRRLPPLRLWGNSSFPFISFSFSRSLSLSLTLHPFAHALAGGVLDRRVAHPTGLHPWHPIRPLCSACLILILTLVYICSCLFNFNFSSS